MWHATYIPHSNILFNFTLFDCNFRLYTLTVITRCKTNNNNNNKEQLQ